MFGFMSRSTSRKPSSAIRKALEKDGLPSGIRRASLLRVVRLPGRFSDRKVTYIRVFDPVRAAARSLDVRRFEDLDSQPGLILKAGHIESDGIVVITRHLPPRDVAMSPVIGLDEAGEGNGIPAVYREAEAAISTGGR